MHLLLELGPFALADCRVWGDSGSPTSLRHLVSVNEARLQDKGVAALMVSPNSPYGRPRLPRRTRGENVEATT
jgi:hypothetical protein